ncbi:MAG TPA: hypothetical protein VGM19_12205 [Armatimonadota bacterium]|jgi:hypothetical protein
MKLTPKQIALHSAWVLSVVALAVVLCVFGKVGLIYFLAGLATLGVGLLFIFRPYWYICFTLVMLIAWSYTPQSKEYAKSKWQQDYKSPWTVRLGGMPTADLMVLAAVARLLADRRFRQRLRIEPYDAAVLVFFLSYVPAALIGLTSRDDINTMTLWFFSVRPAILLAGMYFAVSRLLPRDRLKAPPRFVDVAAAGVFLAILAAAFRALVLHQIERAGTPILMVSEANMLPTIATVGAAYLVRGQISGRRRLWSLLCILAAVAVLLISTRRTVIIVGALAMLAMVAYLPRRYLPRAMLMLAALFLAGAIMAVTFVTYSGTIGKMWVAFMSQDDVSSVSGVRSRSQEMHNVAQNLDKYGGWVFGLGLGRKWERLSPLENLHSGAGFGDDIGHVWLFPTHVLMLRNLLEQGIFGLVLLAYAFWLVLTVTWKALQKRPNDSPEYLLNNALSAAILAGFAVSVVFIFAFPNAAIFSGAMLGALGGLVRRNLEPVATQTPAPGDPVGSPGALGGIGGVAPPSLV